jgi:hypothetical protein
MDYWSQPFQRLKENNMEIFNYLPTIGQLIDQVRIGIGNAQIYWIIVFASALLLLHGMYNMLVVIFFHKLVDWLGGLHHMQRDFLHVFRLAAVISYFVAIFLIILGHFGDLILWTYALIPLNIFNNNPDTLYFVGEMYVTIGYGSFQLEKEWRILPIIIAFTGIFSASMSAAALFNMLGSLIDKSQIDKNGQSSTS